MPLVSSVAVEALSASRMMHVFPSFYLAPIGYYQQLLRVEASLVEVHDHYQKQTLRNRCVIAGPNGLQSLTIPIVKPEAGKVEMLDIRISDHGNWRHQHWNALVSAYRNSPFFEYYADDFAPFYERKWDFLVDYNEELQQLVCSLIDMPVQWQRTTSFQGGLTQDLENAEIHPYYQVFRDKLGFLSNLSIVDMLFNMGPESLLLLQ